MITSRRMKDGTPIMDIEYTLDVPTPHVPWAKPYAKGPLKAFLLPSVKGGRDFVELMQRVDMDATTVTHDRAWDQDKWGFGDFYDQRVRIWEYETVYGYLVDALESDEHYDVIVLQSVNGWGYWPKEARQAILRRVKAGAGLVLVRPFDGPKPTPELKALSPLVGGPDDKVDEGGYAVIAADAHRSAAWSPKGSHFITNNIPFDAIEYDETAYYPYKVSGKTIITAGSGDPIAAVKTVGKGRVVAFGWYNRDLVPQHKEHLRPIGGLSSNSDFWRGGTSSCTWNYVEYIYSLLAKATVWAARRESGVDFKAKVTDAPEPSLVIDLGKNVPEACEVEARVLNQWGVEEMSFKKTLGQGESAVSLPLEEDILADGVHLADIVVKSDSKSAAWGTLRFDLPAEVTVAEITADKEIYGPKDAITASIIIAGKGKGLRLEVAVIDAFDRVVSEKYADTDAGETAQFKLSRRGSLSPQVWIRARLTKDGRLLHQAKSERLTAVPDYDRNIHDMEVVVAQYDRGRGEYIEPVRRQLLEFGATNGYYGYSKLLAESGAKGGGVYWYHRAPYIAQKEKYLRTKDKKYLVRQPCLSDPKFIKEVHDTIVKTARLGKKYAPLSYYVQDEGSLTCYRDENDLCFGKHTIAAFRKWLAQEYKTVGALNKEWGTKFRSWDKVMPMTLHEARAHNNFAPWADHRSFMEIVFADYFKLVHDSVGEVDPGARIRLSGCQVSSAYTGMDYWRLHQIVEYFEAYSGGNQFEFHQSFSGPRTILGTWIGYGQKGRASNHRIWDSYLHQIRLMAVFWESAVVNPDFTLSGSALDMSTTFKELAGSGVSKMLFDAKRNDCGIAVHYSYPSIHAAQALDQAARFDQCREGWLKILQTAGYQQTFLSRQQIEGGDLLSRKFKVLIMPYSMAISPKEVAAIKKFVKAGGRVIADFQTGVFDDHCARREDGSLDDVFGIKRYNTANERFFINGEPRRTADLPKLDVAAVEDAMVVLEEPGVRAESGKPLLLDDFTQAVPAIVINSYGKGKAAYLNISPEIVAADATSAKSKAICSSVAEVLAYFGARPIMKVVKADGKPLDQVEMFGYTTPGVRYYALLRANLGKIGAMAYDGIVHAQEDGGDATERISAAIPAKGHVYDCIEKEYLGHTDVIDSKISSAQAKVFAVLPYQVKGLNASAKAEANCISYEVDVNVSEGKPRNHALVMDVVSPDGVKNRLYSANVLAKDGKARGEILLSLEGESGIWTLNFTEAASGASASVDVVVG